MKYPGGKSRVAKHILSIMLEARGDRTWVEPFVGGANMIDKVDGKRIGNDIHEYLIAVLKAVQNGWIPPTDISQEEYYSIKNNPQNYDPVLVGFVGFLCSYSGKWWAAYARTKGRNFAAEGSRNLVKQARSLVGIDFRCGDYLQMETPKNSLIYCDPPYAGMTKYKDGIDYAQFWDWCRAKKNEGHLVFVSEYSAPDDFECIKEVEHKTTLRRWGDYAATTEKLFTEK